MKKIRLRVLFYMVTATMFFGCASTEKQPTDAQINWVTLCVKQHQITESEIEKFTKDLESEFMATNEFYYLKGIVSEVFKNVFDEKKVDDVTSSGNSYGTDYFSLDYDQMKLLFNKVQKYVDNMTATIYGYSALEVERYSPNGTYDLFAFNAVYGGSVFNYFLMVNKNGVMNLARAK